MAPRNAGISERFHQSSREHPGGVLRRAQRVVPVCSNKERPAIIVTQDVQPLAKAADRANERICVVPNEKTFSSRSGICFGPRDGNDNTIGMTRVNFVRILASYNFRR